MRKENLLVNLRKNFSVDILIELIITDLPIYIQDRIVKTEVTSIEEMLRELRKLESLVQKRKTLSHTNNPMTNKQHITKPSAQTNERKPCAYCELKGFTGRFYPEMICRLKQRDANGDSKNIKTVNNIAVQEHLNETIIDQKN